MSYIITDGCIACCTCIPECPKDAIHTTETQVVIDPAKCISCGTCAAVCPAGTIEQR